MSIEAKAQYLQQMYDRYQRAGRAHKSKILDEFCAVCGYHRKAALRIIAVGAHATGGFERGDPGSTLGPGATASSAARLDAKSHRLKQGRGGNFSPVLRHRKRAPLARKKLPQRQRKRVPQRAELITSAPRCLTVENAAMLIELAKLRSDVILVSSGSEGGYANSVTIEFLQNLPEAIEL